MTTLLAIAAWVVVVIAFVVLDGHQRPDAGDDVASRPSDHGPDNDRGMW